MFHKSHEFSTRYFQIIFPHYMNEHHTVYVINKYSGNLEIFDSRKYTEESYTPRDIQHADRVEIVYFFVLFT